eukprot:symbB.v1.2.034427.t1/scaffold4440.1/size39630/2
MRANPAFLRDEIIGWDGIGYKVGNRLLSIWAGDRMEYALGVIARDAARPKHAGGLYVCKTRARALHHRVPARRGGLFFAPRLLLRCRCEGPFVEYPGGKIACSTLTPMEVLPMPSGYMHSEVTAFQGALPRPSEGLRLETSTLEAEVAEMERRLGYR